MKKLILLFVVTLSTSLIINAQWNYINQENTGDYRVIKFNNESEGWAMGDSCFIQKTTDGGDTWIQVPCNGTANIEDFQFVNDSVAYCAGWYNPGNVHSEVLKYDFANESWNVICTLDSIHIQALHFLDPLTGIIVCGKDIKKTYDGGITWTTVWDASFVGYNSAFPRDLIFVNDSIGFVCGRLKSDNNERRRLILKSTDKGENWFICYLDTISNSNTIYRLNYVKDNPNFVYASTSNPYFFKTSDCGDTWEIIGSDIHHEYKPIYFIMALVNCENCGKCCFSDIPSSYYGKELFKSEKMDERSNKLLLLSSEIELFYKYGFGMFLKISTIMLKIIPGLNLVKTIR